MSMAFASSSRRPGILTLATVVLAASAALLAGCGDKKEKVASQTAAKVNKDEITVHQINFLLQQQRGLRPEQAEAAGKQILERLIDQQLALTKAEEQKLDREPRIVQQLEAAKREILARAYLEKVSDGAAKPTPEEIKKYYEEKPALFKDRRIYQIQELAIEAKPDMVPTLRTKLAGSKNIAEFTEYLKANDIRFNGNQAVRAAEQLPLPSLERFSRMKDGDTQLNVAPNGMVQVIVLAGSRSQPVSEEQARPAIEQFLLNDRKRKLVEDDLKAMRAAAKIEYLGKYAGGPGAAASAPAAATTPSLGGTDAAPAPAAATTPAATAAPAAPAASTGLSASDISKGMGLK